MEWKLGNVWAGSDVTMLDKSKSDHSEPLQTPIDWGCR